MMFCCLVRWLVEVRIIGVFFASDIYTLYTVFDIYGLAWHDLAEESWTNVRELHII